MKTLLWALNSNCQYGCKYCYLDFPNNENPISEKDDKKQLFDCSSYVDIASRFSTYGFQRVFLAGAEPLNMKDDLFEIIKCIKRQNIEVVLCTNGYELCNYYSQIIENNVDAVSVSLDSYDKKYNDYYRLTNVANGWSQVVRGIEELIDHRNGSVPKIGVYSVITKKNIRHIHDTYIFLNRHKVDYFVVQPIYLPKDHILYNELSLNDSYLSELNSQINMLKNNRLECSIPNDQYITLMQASIMRLKPQISGCFAGKDLFFLIPNGTFFGCPNEKKIHHSFLNAIENIDQSNDICNFFCEDCVNMWQLMAFDEFLINRF